MAKIIAPNKAYNGVSASVPFIKGVGETADAHLIEWFRTHGYKVVEDTGEKPNGLEDEKPNKPNGLGETAEEPGEKPVKRGRK